MFSLQILVWNYRGTDSTYFLHHLSLLIRKHPCSILVILKTRVDSSFASNIMAKTIFSNIVVSEACDFLGDIWVLWDLNIISVECISIDEQVINLMVGLKEQ